MWVNVPLMDLGEQKKILFIKNKAFQVNFIRNETFLQRIEKQRIKESFSFFWVNLLKYLYGNKIQQSCDVSTRTWKYIPWTYKEGESVIQLCEVGKSFKDINVRTGIFLHLFNYLKYNFKILFSKEVNICLHF